MAKDMCTFTDKITQTGNLLTKKGFSGIEVIEMCSRTERLRVARAEIFFDNLSYFLHLYKAVINPLSPHQGIMCTSFRDFSFLQHYYFVGVPDGR